MKTRKIKTVQDVVDWRLCLGCGVCAYICPEEKISLVDVLDQGIRPVLANTDCSSCKVCLDVCPAWENDHSDLLRRPGIDPQLAEVFGPVLEVWEGHAVDDDIRHRGASGGLITALALYCLEHEQMHGVLHTGGNSADPVRNQTRMSRSRKELLACTGSRYSPASVCDSLHLIESAPQPCLFIGQPTEVTGLRKAQKLKPSLDQKVGLAISFFCAGSPSTRGTEELLKSRGYNIEEVEEIRYRGLGWPGMFAVRRRGEKQLTPLMTYKESWGFLQRFRPFALHLCPDSSGEDADISCADPWYREVKEGEAGFSLVVVRTERGRALLRRAQAAGYVQLEKSEFPKVVQSQRGLAAKRGAIWGRMLTMRLFGLPAPTLRGYSLFQSWRRSPAKEKFKSIFGTARRILRRGYFRPLPPNSTTSAKAMSGQDRRSEPSAANPPSGVSQKPFKVCLMGASMATGNRGVSALSTSLVKLVMTARPDASIKFLLSSRHATTFDAWLGETTCKVPTVNARMSPKAPLTQQMPVILFFSLLFCLVPIKRLRDWIARRFLWIRTIKEADFIGDIRGGDSFSDIYGLKRFFISSLPVLSVIWLRGRISLLPQTYGPFTSPIGKCLARYILCHAEPILSRDRQSPHTVRELLGRNHRVGCSPDVAFVLPIRQPGQVRAEPPLNNVASAQLVGINVNGLMYNGGYTKDNMFGLKLDYPRFLVRLAESLLADPVRHLLLVPHTFAPSGSVESDPLACEKVRKQLPPELQERVHLVQGEYDQSEIKGVIGLCDFFIGSRMHACIAALSQGIPTVGVAYSKKFVGVFESVGVADAVVSGRECDVEEALQTTMAIFDRRDSLRPLIAANVQKAQITLHSTFAQILNGQPVQNGETSPINAPSCQV